MGSWYLWQVHFSHSGGDDHWLGQKRIRKTCWIQTKVVLSRLSYKMGQKNQAVAGEKHEIKRVFLVSLFNGKNDSNAAWWRKDSLETEEKLMTNFKKRMTSISSVFQVVLVVMTLSANAGDAGDLSWADSVQEDMATHSSILVWRIPWTEEPGELQSKGSERVRHDWSDFAAKMTHAGPWVDDRNKTISLNGFLTGFLSSNSFLFSINPILQ